MPGIGPSRNRKEEGFSLQPALPDIVPYPSQDPYVPYLVYNARDYRISGMGTEQKSNLVLGLVIGIPLALLIWHGIKNKPRGH